MDYGGLRITGKNKDFMCDLSGFAVKSSVFAIRFDPCAPTHRRMRVR